MGRFRPIGISPAASPGSTLPVDFYERFGTSRSRPRIAPSLRLVVYRAPGSCHHVRWNEYAARCPSVVVVTFSLLTAVVGVFLAIYRGDHAIGRDGGIVFVRTGTHSELSRNDHRGADS
jgi:hypothetical protein